MPSHGAACTHFQPQMRWPQIPRQTAQKLPGVPTRNTSAAKPALPGTSTSTFGSCPWSSFFSSSPRHYPIELRLLVYFPHAQLFYHLLGCTNSPEGPTQPLRTCTI